MALPFEQFDAQRPVALAGGEAEFVGGLHPGADGEVGVVGEEDGRGVRPDGGDAADQPVAVEDGHVAGDAVLGADVDGDGPGEALGRSYGDDLGALDAVPAVRGGPQHLVELFDPAAVAVVAAEGRLQFGVLLLQRGEAVVAGAGVADGAYGVADGVDGGRHTVLDRAEDGGGGTSGTVDR